MKKADTNLEYYKYHILNSFEHMTGNHVKCDSFYCNEDSLLKLTPLTFKKEAIDSHL